MTDSIAMLDGYTQEVCAFTSDVELYLLVKPDTDFDGRFKAWDTDEQEFLLVSGWLFTIEAQ
jgi:hypothetical protein